MKRRQRRSPSPLVRLVRLPRKRPRYVLLRPIVGPARLTYFDRPKTLLRMRMKRKRNLSPRLPANLVLPRRKRLRSETVYYSNFPKR